MKISILFLLCVIQAPMGVTAQNPRPPATRTVQQVDDYHGTRVTDLYRWLEDANSKETAEWVGAQNKATFAYLRGLPQREALQKRLTELYNYERWSPPARRGNRFFFLRNDGLQNQDVLWVSENGRERVLLDPNTLSADGTVALTSVAANDEGTLLAYSLAAAGSDWNEFKVRDVADGKDLGDHLRWSKFSQASWTKDGKGFFYGRYPEPAQGEELTAQVRNMKLYYHRVGTEQAADVLVYERPDQPDWGFAPEVTDDGRWLVISVWMGTDRRNRIHVLDLGDPDAPTVTAKVHPVLDAFDAGYTFLSNDGPIFHFRTDRDAPKGRIVAVDIRNPEPTRWRELIPEQASALDQALVVGDHFAINYLEDAKSRLRLFALDGTPRGDVTLPGIGTVGGMTGRREDTDLYFLFTSPLTPSSVMKTTVATNTTLVHRAPKVTFDASRYETRQVFYHSKDGTRVPMFVTHRKGIALDGTNPVLLYAYGGFNVNLLPAFAPERIAWLEAGGIYAQPNLRGGGEYGEAWHEAGMHEKKQNVFDDFIAAAEFLVREKYTTPSRLVIEGASNGGLLVGAVMNQRPDLFAVALPGVGVMDMLRFHRFTIGWAWVTEYGSADSSQAQFETLRAYSPLHNLKPGTNYPAVLITTADHDDRVVPAHSFKYAAALQAATTWARPAYIRIETKAGHGAGKPIAKQIEEEADKMAFALANVEKRAAVP
jgi:prolyl oligopeptidase